MFAMMLSALVTDRFRTHNDIIAGCLLLGAGVSNVLKMYSTSLFWFTVIYGIEGGCFAGTNSGKYCLDVGLLK